MPRNTNITTTTTRRPPGQQSSFLRLVALVILGLIVVVGLAVLIAWLVVKPKKLVYTIEDASVQNLNVNNDHVNATYDFIIKSHNPNKRVSIYYDAIELSVAYYHQSVAFNTLMPFYQSRRNVTQLEAKLISRDVALPHSVSRSLRVDKISGQVKFDVRIKARIRYKVGIIKTGHYTLNILCSTVTVPLVSSKNFQRTYCDLDY